MHGIEKRIKMRHLLEQGLSKTATALRLRISRRTVYNWIREGELERDPDDRTLAYGPRAPKPTKIDPYKSYVDRRLSDYPDLTAARLFREIREEGFTGSYGAVKKYVRTIRENEKNSRRRR